MSYKSWISEHGKKHKIIVDRLKTKGFSREEIVDYFDFDNMVNFETGFCYLYAENKKCHPVKNLNCYLCACPLFRFNASGIEEIGDKTVYSYCVVESKFGKQGEFGNAIHQDCSKCSVPHGKKYVLKNYKEDWISIMHRCNIEDN